MGEARPPRAGESGAARASRAALSWWRPPPPYQGLDFGPNLLFASVRKGAARVGGKPAPPARSVRGLWGAHAERGGDESPLNNQQLESDPPLARRWAAGQLWHSARAEKGPRARH